MNKVPILIIIAVVLAGAAIWILIPVPANVQIPEGIILFYGEGCSHCKNVDDFIAQNGIESEIDFIKLEVWYNKNNQSIISQVAQKCGLDTGSIGVPLLYDGAKCYEGDVDTINFFKNKAGIK